MPHDSILTTSLLLLSEDKRMDTLAEDVQRVFGDFEETEQELTQAFKHVKYYYPNFKPMPVYTAITGFGSDLYISDAMMLISTEMFLGNNTKFRPPQMPNYILRRFTPEYVVPAAMIGLSEKYLKTDMLDKTVLKEALDWGRTYYFVQKMIPCLPDSILMGYTSQEMKDLAENEDVVWAHFVKNDLFFSGSGDAKRRYIDERPNIPEIGNKCPGRAGRWLGLQIVRHYARKNDVLLQEIMAETNTQKIFEQSGYKPKPKA